MAAAVTFCRLLCRGGGAAALSLPPGARCFGVRTSPTGEKVTHTGQVTAAACGASEGAEPRSGPVFPAHGARVSRVPRRPGPADAPRPLLSPGGPCGLAAPVRGQWSRSSGG